MKPEDTCDLPKSTRCCNTIINKFKINADPKCQGSIKQVTVNGAPTAAVYYEKPVWGKTQGFIAKITNMDIPFSDVDNTLICFTIQGQCNSLQELTPPELKDQNTLE